MNNVIGIIVALVVIVGGGWYFLSGQEDKTETEEITQSEEDKLVEQLEQELMEKKEDEEVMMKKEEEGVMEKHEGDSMEKMEKEDVMIKEEEVMEKEDGEVMEKTDDVMEKKEDVMIKEEPVAQASGTFTTYSASKVAQANGDVVIGFFADWCPSCRALKSDINSDLTAIPAGLTILDANYDSETDLKKKYGVTTQHTLVQVNANGELITKWRGGNTLSSVVAKVQ